MEPIVVTLEEARRLAVLAQRLAGPRPPATKEKVMELFHALNCVQIDPIRAVERTQLLVLWSRLGAFDPALLDRLQGEDRLIFEAWAHCASYVLTEDFPLFAHHMTDEYDGGGVWGERIRTWMDANAALRQHILDRLAAAGPLATPDFEDVSVVPWESTGGWSNGRTVTRMLDFLYYNGTVLSVGRKGNTKYWHLAERWLPPGTDQSEWGEEDVVRRTTHKSLRALGIATAKQINNHFIRKRYPGLAQRLAELQEEGVAVPARIVGSDGEMWADKWLIHRESLPGLDAIRRGGWQPRTVLLSPFDNLICDRERTQQLWDFYYRIEIYVPAAKRQYGYYVLPILHGDRFIGRIDSKMDRKSGVYTIHALYPENEADVTGESGRAIAATLGDLAGWIGAKSVELGENIPTAWRTALESL
ncbi:MAG: YcaQ family DNA glycosylase [Chloroflexi bacterium]|nr:YcaQ family DNA glycosylase [Chloroflexota bacterium]